MEESGGGSEAVRDQQRPGAAAGGGFLSPAYRKENEHHYEVKAFLLSCIRLFAAPWTVARQAPLSMEFSRQEHWSGVPFPSPGGLPDPDPTHVFCIAGRFFTV